MFWKRKTDEEYVEYQRKWLNRSKWMAGLHVVAAISLVVVMVVFLYVFFKLNTEAIGWGLPVGFLVGVFIGLGFIKAGLYAGFALIWLLKPRTIRLMIEYHDRLHEKEKQPVVS